MGAAKLPKYLSFMAPEDDLAWQASALCAQTDPETFFPEKGGGSIRDAKATCLSCDVRAECLEYALANDERFGVWGGLSERERRKLQRGGRISSVPDETQDVTDLEGGELGPQTEEQDHEPQPA